jgi:hypothetical protein
MNQRVTYVWFVATCFGIGVFLTMMAAGRALGLY